MKLKKLFFFLLNLIIQFKLELSPQNIQNGPQPCILFGWAENNYVWTFVKKGGTRICNAYEMTYEFESTSVDLLYFSQCKNRSTTNNNNT